MIHKIINVSNPTICERTFTYDVRVNVNDRTIIKAAQEIDNKFNDWHFFLELSVTNGIVLLNGFYFINSMGQKVYMIVGLSPEEWDCAKAMVLMDYTRR